ncbi:glycosyltransferase family 2 protein [Catenovulum maritimum]|uniref:Glycosyl transferase family 2 n=1 Tax=Catenovulum maritimum TaxID=1513271 RepID=A0A0J8GSJ4_9ALTE|nr:glycosyltransferase family 2 protein [Catenovulum maritimum]KMT65707.1 glycosyl transferase family 2 [Catenovulum maritimum]
MPQLISVIFTTYNSIDWLQKVLWGFECQTDQNFEVIIADDGSTTDTKDFINAFKKSSKLKIKHVWHEDNGFQKCIILNKAITAAEGNYLVFTDGDCIPRKDFVKTHRDYATPGYFLSGGYFKLPMETSKAIAQQDVASGDAFDINWLMKNGYPAKGKKLRLTASGFQAKLCNWLIPTAKTWNGHNASGWKADIIKVNGFDERMQYGGEDCEMGDRLKFSGLKVKRIRYSAICVHLDHARGYVNQAMKDKNKAIRNETIKDKKTYTHFGISQE